MTKKLIIFDLDGTLLTDTKKLLHSTKEAVKDLHMSGHEVAIATGRNTLMAKEIIKEAGIDHYIICNGAAAYMDGKEVYINPLESNAFKRLMEKADTQGHALVYETADNLKRRDENINDRVHEGMKHVGQPVPEYEPDFFKNNNLIQALLFYNENEKDFYENGQFPEFRFVRWYKDAVDVLPANGSKYETIARVANENGFKQEEIVAFGDGLNDLEMITNAGTGVAMENALDIVKENANLVTRSNNNDGIKIGLEKLNLI